MANNCLFQSEPSNSQSLIGVSSSIGFIIFGTYWDTTSKNFAKATYKEVLYTQLLTFCIITELKVKR